MFERSGGIGSEGIYDSPPMIGITTADRISKTLKILSCIKYQLCSNNLLFQNRLSLISNSLKVCQTLFNSFLRQRSIVYGSSSLLYAVA